MKTALSVLFLLFFLSLMVLSAYIPQDIPLCKAGPYSGCP